jgi:hypothetical protein
MIPGDMVMYQNQLWIIQKMFGDGMIMGNGTHCQFFGYYILEEITLV